MTDESASSPGSGSDTRRTGYAKGERTKARVLESALELFSRWGFNTVSLRDLAAHAGMSHAGLLHHFPGGKDEILGRVLELRDESDIVTWLAPSHGPADRLAAVVSIVRRNASTPDVVALYAKLSNEATDADHPAHDYFRRRYERVCGYLAEQFRAVLPPSSPIAPEAAAQQLIAMLDGLQTQWLLFPDKVDMAARAEDFLRLLGIPLAQQEPIADAG